MGTKLIKFLIFLFFAIISGTIAIIFINQRYQAIIVEIPKFVHQTKNNITPKPPLTLRGEETPSSLPDTQNLIPNTLLLPVPFTPQAPTTNWDTLHNEGCEEASAIMAEAYYHYNDNNNSNGQLKPDYVENQITKLTKWQDDHFGYHLDVTSAETAEMMEQVYGLKTRLIDNFTADVLKKELAQNHLVIISEYGRALNNPFYKRPGPIHHMLLVKGYDNDQFITNDSGTKRGLNYFYDFKTLYDATADWAHELKNVDSNKKIAIVVWDAQRP
jgi:hypothetical protein